MPVVVQIVAVAVLAVAVGRRPRAWRLRWLPLSAVAGVVLAGAAFVLVGYLALADDPAPASLWGWIGVTAAAVVLAAAGWRSVRWWRRAASVLASVLCAVCVALRLDAWTGYLPTLDSAWGRATGAALPNQTDVAGALDLRRRHVRPTHGVLVSITTGDDASGFAHRDELAYLPPAWFDGDSPPELPAVLMAGGEFGHPADWPTAGGARQTADDFAASHGGNAPILVFVDTSGRFSNDTECVNGLRGNAADHLTKDVVPYVVSHFGVSPDPSHWGIVGWSSGGTCAVVTAVMHPDLFSAFVDVDGGLRPDAGSRQQTIARLFGGDASAFEAFDPATVMAAHGPYVGLAGWFAPSTTGDPVYRPAAAGQPADPNSDDVDPSDHEAVSTFLCSVASGVGIPCAVVPVGGNHDFATAATAFGAALPWLAGRLGTPGVPAVDLPGAMPAP
ncbi:alpha/beta hydrolase family protein [Mycolicibacterium sp. P1-18]|uniref:alpha/beta hydrolase n=1 Tax=Mycolicibacterium sp. P1-18 TaxID=2024615 RepID=UPI001F5BE4A6|nr:alpha/beta hydrolase-fold protein [Mycolicibacterium sp. P1-18]